MALNSGFANLDPVSDTFSDWLNKTNEMITLMREDVITANTAGAETSGDAILIGSFYANNLIAHDSLRGGDYAASDTLYISSNVHVQNTALDTIIWKDFEVNGNSHFGATANGSHTVQITGDFLVSLDATFQNDMYIDGTSANAVQWLSATDEMNFNDNVELTFGTDSDLVIRHNGTDSEIADNGTGNLYIRATNLTLSANDGSRYIVGNDGTSVEIFSPAANTLEVTITDVGMKVENEANTNTLTVRSTSRLQGNIGIEGSTNANTVTWDKTTNTLNFDDNNFATFGTSGDLSIYHNGTNSLIENNTGEMIVQADNFTLRGDTALETMMDADLNGAVRLFYDASVHTTAKLVTQEGGIIVTGNTVADGFVAGDNEKVQLGDAQDLEMYHDGTNSRIDSKTGAIVIKNTEADNDIILSADDSTGTGQTDYFRADGSTGDAILYHYGSQKLATKSIGVEIEGEANTDTLRVQSTSDFEGNINVQGSTSADTVTWTKSTNTMNFDSNNFATFGTGGELSVFHDGTNSYIRNTTGELIAQGNGITLRSHTGTESYLTADVNGAVSLFYDASVHTTAKLVTQAGGVTVTGNVVADGFVAGDGEKVQLGNAQDLEIFHEATGNSIIQENGAGSLVLKANNTIIQSTAGENYFQGVADGAATVYYNGNAKLDTKSDGVDVTGLTTTDTLEVQGDATFDGTSTDVLQWVSASDTLNFDDSVKATFGTDGDMKVYHTGTTGIIDSLNTDIISNTSLDVKTNALIIESATGENYITATVNGQVDLYFDNNVKLETKTGGIQVTGNVVADGFVAGDGEKVQLGASQDLQIFHEATGNSIIQETGSGSLVLKANNSIIQSTSGQNYFQGVAGGAATLYHAGSAKIDTTSGGVEVTGDANTTTLHVQSTASFDADVNFDGTTVDAVTWSASANTWTYGDNVTVFFGPSDFSIAHDATDTNLINRTGDLYIQQSADDKDVIIQSDDGAGGVTEYIRADGLISGTILYSAGTNRLQTTNTGVTVTGVAIADGLTMGTNEVIRLGSNNVTGDLQIYHNGVDTGYLMNQTGNLDIRTASGFDIRSSTTPATYYMRGQQSGDIKIYHPATNSYKFQTTTSGIKVIGNVEADGLIMGDGESVRLGNDTDLTIQHSGTNGIIENNTGTLYIQSNTITLRSDQGTPEPFITAVVDGGVTLYYNNGVALTTRSGGTDIAGEANTGTLLVNGISNTAGIAYFQSSVQPTTTGNDLGTSSLRWDAFLTNVDADGYIQPTSNTQNLGQTNARWQLFANTISATGAIDVDGSATLGSLIVEGTSLFSDTMTVNADATCTANVTTENLQVNGTANLNILQIVDLHANNFAIVGGDGEITLSSSATDVVIDTVPASESRGFKYFIEGRNTNTDSCYVVEISVAHNGTDVFFTRYGEVANNFDAVWNVGINGANVELMVTCSGAAPATNVHSFNIVKYQTR